MHIDIFNLLIVIAAAWSAGRLATRLGYPAVLGELLCGVLIGPAVLGIVHGDQALAILAELGVLLMMLYIGLEVDGRKLLAASWGGLLVAVGGFIVPMTLCGGLLLLLGSSPLAALFVGLAAGVTSLATKSRILVELDIMHSRIAHVLMAGAVVTDLACLLVFAAVIGAAQGGGVVDMSMVGAVGLRAAAFVALVGLTGRFVAPVAGAWLERVFYVDRTHSFTLVVAVALGFAELAELAGLHGVLGAFVAGLFLDRDTIGDRLLRRLRHGARDSSLGLLAPIFFVTAGFHVDPAVLRTDLGLLTALILLATVGKLVGTALFYLPTGNGWREGIVIGAGMNGRGAVEIILAGVALDLGLIDARLFSILVVMAITTTATVPVLLRWGVGWLRGRGELVEELPDDEQPNVELPVVHQTAR